MIGVLEESLIMSEHLQMGDRAGGHQDQAVAPTGEHENGGRLGMVTWLEGGSVNHMYLSTTGSPISGRIAWACGPATDHKIQDQPPLLLAPDKGGEAHPDPHEKQYNQIL